MPQSRIVKGRSGERDRVFLPLAERPRRRMWPERVATTCIHGDESQGESRDYARWPGGHGRVNDRSAPLTVARRVAAARYLAVAARDAPLFCVLHARDAFVRTRPRIPRETDLCLAKRRLLMSRTARSALFVPAFPSRGPAVKRRHDDPHLSTVRERMSRERRGGRDVAGEPRRPGISSAAWWQPCRRLQLSSEKRAGYERST